MAKHSFKKDENGVWAYEGSPKVLTEYRKQFIEYLNYLDPYFKAALEASEFNFIWCLLRIRNLTPMKYDLMETQEEVSHLTEINNRKFGPHRNMGTHSSLYRYGLIVEGDVYYSTLMNLIRCSKNLGYMPMPFPDLPNGDPYPTMQKLIDIKKISRGLPHKAPLFRNFYDNELRNAVFHANYQVDNEGLHILGRRDRTITVAELGSKINSAFAFADAFTLLLNGYKNSYTDTKIIPGTHGFLGTQAHVIVRKNSGVTGIVEVPSETAVDYRVGRFFPGESDLIDSGIYLLPENKLESAQQTIYRFPRIMQKYVKNYFVRRYGNE